MNIENKINEQADQKQIMDTENILMVTRWNRGQGILVKQVKGLRSTNWSLQNSNGDVKYNIGNIVAKEHTCMINGQWCGDSLREWEGLAGSEQRRKIGTNEIA